MRGLVGIVVVAAACSNPAGLTIEVIPNDPEVKTIELFVGDRCYGPECPDDILPPGLGPMRISGAYLVADKDPWPHPVDDGVAGFRIETVEDVKISIIVIVGYDANGEPIVATRFHDVEVSASDAELWRVDHLPPVEPLADVAVGTLPPPSGTQRIKKWQGPSLPACLLLESWDETGTADRELVVPDTDRDCDGPMPNECAPWTFNAMLAPPTLDTADCVRGADDMLGSVCVIGGPQCSETNLTGEACEPLAEDYCVPQELCNSCGYMPGGVDCLGSRFRTAADPVSLMPRLRCHISLGQTGEPCSEELIVADAGTYLGSGSTKCTAMRLNDLTAPLGQFYSGMPIGESAHLKVWTFTQPCKADLKFEGTSPTDLQLGAVELELDNSRHLVVPLVVELVRGDCIVDSRCDFTPIRSTVETMQHCVAEAPTMACAPSGVCLMGPQCGATCCNPGETCSPDFTCLCGGTTNCSTLGQVCVLMDNLPDTCNAICCTDQTSC